MRSLGLELALPWSPTTLSFSSWKTNNVTEWHLASFVVIIHCTDYFQTTCLKRRLQKNILKFYSSVHRLCSSNIYALTHNKFQQSLLWILFSIFFLVIKEMYCRIQNNLYAYKKPFSPTLRITFMYFHCRFLFKLSLLVFWI